MAELLEKTERRIVNIGGTLYVSIPQLWLGLLKIKDSDIVTVALMRGKKGEFLGVWSKVDRWVSVHRLVPGRQPDDEDDSVRWGYVLHDVLD